MFDSYYKDFIFLKVKTKKEQIDIFYSQGDFGYIRDRLTELRPYCNPQTSNDSSLECVDHLRMCRARNIVMDFKDLGSSTASDRYREDTFKPGQLGGKCKLDSDMLKRNGDHKSPLQSWYSELQYFTQMDENPLDETSKHCDIVVNEPTFIIKLDAGVNMYHHFCDFINLYASQHANNSFSQNVNIVLWDTSAHEYWSYFSDMWKVFSNKKPVHLKTYDKKRVKFGFFFSIFIELKLVGREFFRIISQKII